MRSLPRLEGDPGTVLGQAARLRALADRAEALRDTTLGLRAARWDGPAGVAFASRLAVLPPVLGEVARRLGGASDELRGLAGSLEDLQRRVLAAVLAHEAAWLEVEQWARRASAEPDETLRAAHRAAEREWARAGAAAATAHHVAMEEWRAVDARCAAALRALTLDSLADTTAYRLWHAGHDVLAAGVSVTAWGPLKPLSTLGAVGVAAMEVGFRVAWDEGEWSGIALESVLLVAGPASSTLRKAAAAQRLPLGRRLVRGAGESLLDGVSPRRILAEREAAKELADALAAERAAAVARVGSAAGRRLLDARLRVEQAVEQALRDDVRTLRRGTAEQRALVAGAWAVDGATRAGSVAAKVREARSTRAGEAGEVAR